MARKTETTLSERAKLTHRRAANARLRGERKRREREARAAEYAHAKATVEANWGYIGDLNEIHSRLAEATRFLTGAEEV